MLYNFHKSLKNNKLSPLLPRKIRSRVSALARLLMLLASAGCMAVSIVPDREEADRIEFLPTLGAPTGVAVSASNRRITIAWSAIPGATSYAIAVRLKNELTPRWREYTTPSSPYTIADMWAMSGRQYEVRVAAVNAHGQSEWSGGRPNNSPRTPSGPCRRDCKEPAPVFGGTNHTSELGQPASIYEPVGVALVYLQCRRVRVQAVAEASTDLGVPYDARNARKARVGSDRL